MDVAPLAGPITVDATHTAEELQGQRPFDGFLTEHRGGDRGPDQVQGIRTEGDLANAGLIRIGDDHLLERDVLGLDVDHIQEDVEDRRLLPTFSTRPNEDDPVDDGAVPWVDLAAQIMLSQAHQTLGLDAGPQLLRRLLEFDELGVRHPRVAEDQFESRLSLASIAPPSSGGSHSRGSMSSCSFLCGIWMR